MSDFKAEMHKIPFPLGLRPTPRWVSLQRSPDLLAGFKGAYVYGKGGGEEGREREGEGKGGKGRDQAPKYFGLEPPLSSAEVSGCQRRCRALPVI